MKPELVFRNKNPIKQMIFTNDFKFVYIIEKSNRICRINTSNGLKEMDFQIDKSEIVKIHIEEKNHKLFWYIKK